MGLFAYTRTRSVSVAALGAVALCVAAVPAFAQDDRSAEVSAGYLNVSGLMHGWNAQVSKQLTRHWAVVGEINGARGRDCSGCDPVYNDHSALGGVRYSVVRRKPSPSWQFLAGMLHSKSEPYSATLIFAPPVYWEGETVNYVALQPGGGLTVMLTPRVGIRTQADIQFAIPDQSQYQGFTAFPRVTVGAVVRLGGR